MSNEPKITRDDIYRLIIPSEIFRIGDKVYLPEDDVRQLLSDMGEMLEAINNLFPFDIVSGDCFQRTNPHTRIMGNSNTAWAVSKEEKSAHKMRLKIKQLSEALAKTERWRKV